MTQSHWFRLAQLRLSRAARRWRFISNAKQTKRIVLAGISAVVKGSTAFKQLLMIHLYVATEEEGMMIGDFF